MYDTKKKTNTGMILAQSNLSTARYEPAQHGDDTTLHGQSSSWHGHYTIVKLGLALHGHKTEIAWILYEYWPGLTLKWQEIINY